MSLTARVCSWLLKYLSQQQAPEDWRQVIPNQFEGGAGIRKLLLVQNKTR